MTERRSEALLAGAIALIAGMLLVCCGIALANGGRANGNALGPPAPDHMQIIKTRDGSTFVGKIAEVGAGQVRFETAVGTIVIPADSIIEVTEVPAASIKHGKYWFPDPNGSRLYLFPTGRMLPAGNAYFADYYIFFATGGYAVTDWCTLGAGMTLIPGLGLDRQLFYFTPKIGLAATGRLHVASGALILKIPGLDKGDETPLVGLADVVATYGEQDWGFTAGLGYGFAGHNWADRPLVLIGLDRRVSRHVTLISENWILPGVEDPMISYGVRFFGENLSADLAFFNIIGEHSLFPGIPFVSFVFNF
jgi:hypothetical protein